MLMASGIYAETEFAPMYSFRVDVTERFFSKPDALR